MIRLLRTTLPGLLLLAAPLVTLADPPMGPGHPCEPGAQPHHPGPPPPPPLAAELAPPDAGPGIPPDLRRLNLSQAQQDQVFEIVHAQVPAQRERMKAVHAAREAMRDVVAAERFDAQRARSIADGEAQAMSELLFARAATEARILALLTPEQRAQWREQRKQCPPR